MQTQSTIAEVTLHYKSGLKLSELPQIKGSQSAEVYLRSIWSNKIEHVEELYLVLLNRANRVLGYMVHSCGGNNGTCVDPKLLFQAAIKANAQSIIIAHNHPSGNIFPSNEDITITKKILAAGKFLEINLQDHLILTSEDYYSFADSGMLY